LNLGDCFNKLVAWKQRICWNSPPHSESPALTSTDVAELRPAPKAKLPPLSSSSARHPRRPDVKMDEEQIAGVCWGLNPTEGIIGTRSRSRYRGYCLNSMTFLGVRGHYLELQTTVCIKTFSTFYCTPHLYLVKSLMVS
jgi:hypothetical protein